MAWIDRPTSPKILQILTKDTDLRYKWLGELPSIASVMHIDGSVIHLHAPNYSSA